MNKYIIIFILLIISTNFIYCSFKPVLLKDVSVLTLKHDKLTAARRVSPIQQLECVGGSASQEYSMRPKVVQCKNVGWDGNDVQWECTANIDTAVKLGKIDVSCEGYDFPEDPYILSGSCGLTYELEYTDPIQREKYYETKNRSDNTAGFVILFIIICFFIWAIYSGSNNASNNYPPQQPIPGDGGYPPQPPYGGYPPNNYGPGNPYGNGGPYYPNPYTPSAPGGGCVPQQAPGGWRPGFWSGAGLGYLFGRGSSRSNYYPTHHTPSYTPSRSYFGGGSRSTGISSSSSSFSSTSRR